MVQVLRAALASILLLAVSSGVQAQTNVDVNANVLPNVDDDLSTFTAAPTSVPADGIALSTLVVTARNAANQVLPNKFVTITSSRGLLDFIDCDLANETAGQQNTGTTNASGRLTCFVSSTTVGLSTYTAVVDTVTLKDKPTVNFTAVGGGGEDPPPPPPDDEDPPPGGGGTTEPPTEPPTIPERINKVIQDIADAVPQGLPGAVGLATIVPSLAILTPVTSSISIALLGGIPGLQYLLYSLFPFFKPPRKWGTVRDAATRVPIPGVFVSLFSLQTGKEIKRIMTDKTGRFGFLTPQPGQYWVQVSNPLYLPYRSELINIDEKRSEPLTFDIFLAAREDVRVASLKKVAKFTKFVSFVTAFQLVVLIAGSLLSLLFIYQARSLENILLVSLYALLWVMRLLGSSKVRRFGLVKDQTVDIGLGEAVIQVTSDSKGEQSFIHSTITDEAGRFIILVPPGKHSVIAAKSGYQPAEKKIIGEAEDVQLNLQRASIQPAATG
jgi:hypothetical protein